MRLWIMLLTLISSVLHAGEVSKLLLTKEQVVAYTLWMEARGEGIQGMNAVANVIRWRSALRRMEPSSICLQRLQFSCWTNRWTVPKLSPKKDKEWQYCLTLAHYIVTRTLPPWPIATHYYNPTACNPAWAAELTKVTKIGNHIFGYLKT